MDTQKLADVLDRFAGTVADFANDLRDELQHEANDGGMKDPYREVEDGAGQEVDFENEVEAKAEVGNVIGLNRIQKDRVAADATVQVPVGDLWKLVNRSRKMIRLAREGKVPSMEQRAPLCRAIKALKAQGAIKKPYNLRD